ncbi:acyl-CoA dehydrogenase family protein [candidate division CSSED10-310 bacterium]|uniref:Acyl-CoA dehydrogenase family protein n=1 Tax=candidate division CSSED10-310 bacterium TaxID=2855610 RepID=A0ABV6YZJ5_UNCC1
MDFALTDEQKMFKETVKKFTEESIAPYCEEADLKGEFSREAWQQLGEFGLLSLHFPEEYGGQDSDALTACIAGEALGEGGADGGLVLAMGAHTYLCGDTILNNGTAAQKEKYLPKLASGEWIGCMGLTEPDAGSDAAAISTTAVKEGDRYILNGTKTFITNGPLAEVAVIFAVTNKEAGHFGVSAFLVDKGTPGFEAGKKMNKLGVRSSTTSELFMDEVEIPVENLLGQEGTGFIIALHALEWDRSALLAPFVGAMNRALSDCANYAIVRKQFGRSIADFQAIQHKIADMKVFVEAARLLVYRVAWNKDQGKDLNHMEASIAKLFVGDWGMPVASEAVQIHGGYGFMHEYPVERLFRDVKLAQIGGGTSEIQRMIIARMLKERAS